MIHWATIGSTVSAQATTVNLYCTMDRPFPSKLPFPTGHPDPHLIDDFLGLSES